VDVQSGVSVRLAGFLHVSWEAWNFDVQALRTSRGVSISGPEKPLKAIWDDSFGNSFLS